MASLKVVTTIPDTFASALAGRSLLTVATTAADGAPQSSPVWFIWDDETFKFVVDNGGKKARDIQRDPRISVSLFDLNSPINYIEVRGKATVAIDRDNAIADQLARKYLSIERQPWTTAENAFLVVTVHPERTIVQVE